jgi:hypothetical protein
MNFNGARKVADFAVSQPHVDAQVGWANGRFYIHAGESEPGPVATSAKELELAAHPLAVHGRCSWSVDANQFRRARFDQCRREGDGAWLGSRNTLHRTCGASTKENGIEQARRAVGGNSHPVQDSGR